MAYFIDKIRVMQLSFLIVCFLSSQNVTGQLSLPWTEDFEGATAGTYTTNQNPIPGLTGPGYSWEVQLGGNGRARTNAGAGFYNGGNRAITLDAATNGTVAINYLIGNLDLSNYGGSNDLELTFNYSHHGEESSPNDRVWMRGSSANAWVQVYDTYANRPATGQYTSVTLDIDDLMQTAGQAITSTFQIRFGQEDNFQASSPTASDGFSFDDITITGSLPLPNNAGITAMLSPVLGAVSGTYPVDVTLNNFGNNTLNSVDVYWSINGAAPTLVNFTGLGLAQSTSTPVNLSAGTLFPPGITNLRFWTSDPNGLPDPDNNNDTLDAFFCTGLAGTYTVGTAASDFPTIQDALTALYGCGVGGLVTLQVQPGTYNSLTIDQPIPGISATNRVIWDGSAQAARITVNGGAAVTLDGADYITIQNFFLENTTTTQGWGVLLTNSADYNEILNNRVQMGVTNAFNTAGIVASASPTAVTSSGINTNYTLIEGNVITGADRGISLQGSFTVADYNNGNIIRNNDISDADVYGIYAYYQDSIMIEGNNIHDLPSTFHYGIFTFSLMNFDIISNVINVDDVGIDCSNSNSRTTPTRQALIANNMVSTATDRGIDLFLTRETDFYHNTILAGGSACVWSNFDNTVDIKNNIFASTSATNYAFETFSTATFTDMDYNVFYTDPANPNLIDYGNVYTDLADWQTNGVNGYDQNSLEGLPNFNSPTDLHVDGSFLNDRGITTTVVLTDVDGDVRPAIGAASVDIGADEFTPPSNDAGVASLVSPTLPITGGFSSVEIIVENYGISPLSSFTVEWVINGGTPIAVPYTGAPVPVGGTTNMILANINFPANTTSLEFWTSMPNGTIDERPSNDTLTVEICPGLSGTYSVGHPSSDYPTVAEAIDALTRCGVSGPVTMEFVAGTYIGPWVLNEIPGASLTNTVTFDGLNAAATTVTHDASGPNTAAVVSLDGVDYFTIKNFRIENTGTTTPAYGVLLTNQANYNTIDNNEIIVPIGTATNVVGVLTSNSYTSSVGGASEGNNANHTTISNNDISGGVANIILEGGVSNFENIGNSIIGNEMHDADDYGIFADEQDSFLISGNTIYNLNATTADAVQLQDIRNFSILGNDITSRDYGIAIFGGFGAGDEVIYGLVANNMVLCGAGGEAFYLREANLISVYHNTFSATRACWLDNHANIDLRNNILNATTGECFYTLDPFSMSGMDHNLYFISGTGGRAVRFGTQTYVTLADWQASGIGYDLNSVSGNPNFVNGLYLGGSLAVDTGDLTLTTPILTDINGDPRPLGTRPDIGADEHVIIANDATIVNLKSPSGCGSPAHDVIIQIANVGSTLILSAPITVNVTGDATATFNTTHPILVSGVTIDKNVGTINTEAGGQYNFEIIISAGTDLNRSNDTLRTSITIPPSNQFALSMTGDTLVCDSSTAMVSAVASYVPSTIIWYDAPTGGNIVHVGDAFTTPNLSATTMYYAEIQGCASPRAVATVDVDLLGINVDLGPDQTICGGTAATLTPTVTVSPATSLIWSDGSQSAFIEATATGTYTATVMNAAGCMATDSIDVTVSAAPTVADVVGNVSCGGAADGSIDLTVTGGVGPYSYQWSNASTGANLTGLSGGFYNVTLTDNGTASNCTYVSSFQVTEPTALSVNVDATSVACNGNDGTVDISVLGGSPNYTYNWSTSATTQDLTNAPAGTHTVSITDANGCQTTATATVAATTPITVTIDSIYAEIMAIAGGVDITATGGSGNFQYVWNTGATTSDITGLVAGTYEVTVTDLTTGCQQVVTGIVVPYQLPDFVTTIPALDAFKLYPNPTEGRVFVNITLTETTEVQLEVMSITGQVLQSFEPRESLEQNYEIDMTDYPSGVYLARFVIDNKVITEKIIVE